MANRLLDLEKSLGGGGSATRSRTSGRRKKRAHTAPAPAPVGAAPAPAAGTAPPVRAQAAVNYRVPGLVAALKQPSPKTCWATVTTMMMMWREQASMSIPAAIGRVGSSWLAMFNADQGLLSSQKAAFLAAAGLTHEWPQSLTASGWEGLLRQFGPLWVTTDEDPSANFAIHARIMTCIRGDGSENGTTLDIVDPLTGTSYQEKFGKFLEKYESEARASKRPLRIQIVHWPHDAGFNVARSMTAQESTWAFSLASQGFVTVDKAEFEPRYDEARPGARVTRAQSMFAFSLKSPKKMTATDVRWASDSNSPDYRHLGKAIDTAPFVLNGTVIDRLVRLNHVSLSGVNVKVVFGLRGCTMDADQASFVGSVSAREVEPNHIDNRCIIGVWDSTTGKIAAFQASTVPNWEYMESYRQNHADKANMLPCGKYAMVVGTHRPKKEDAQGKLVDNPGRVQGALRNDQTVIVLRTEDDLSYTVKDTWDEAVANDNIHAGIVKVNTGTSTEPDYSSAGCHTVPGTSTGDTPAGAWAEFRAALGLDNAKATKDDGQKFAYVLFTGREARLVATGKDADAPVRLRFGSDGAAVRSLQDALAKHAKKYYRGKTDGDFGSGTSMAFIKYQKDRDAGAADGIVTPTDATALGFTLTAPATPVAKQLDVIGKVIDFARGIFKKVVDAVSARADEGRFVMTSDIAEVMHDDTPTIAPWTTKSAHFAFKTYSPPSGVKDILRLDIKTARVYRFLFRLSFEYNGYDIRNAQIQRVIQGSSSIKDQKLEVKFTAKRASGARSEVSQIDFLMNGKWDPGVGDKFIDFGGKVSVKSNGEIAIEHTQSRIAELDAAAGKFTSIKVGKPVYPNVIKYWHAVFFDVDKDTITPKEMQLFKDWRRALEKEDVRWRRLIEGLQPVHIVGYASPTGKAQHNQDLSVRRKEKVKKLLLQEFSSAVKIIEGARGEPNPEDKNELEDDAQRRVDISFEIASGG
ncbi:MAG: papain-like cysteine protease family protein [Gemmatimonadaceae bacterium]